MVCGLPLAAASVSSPEIAQSHAGTREPSICLASMYSPLLPNASIILSLPHHSQTFCSVSHQHTPQNVLTTASLVPAFRELTVPKAGD